MYKLSEQYIYLFHDYSLIGIASIQSHITIKEINCSQPLYSAGYDSIIEYIPGMNIRTLSLNNLYSTVDLSVYLQQYDTILTIYTYNRNTLYTKYIGYLSGLNKAYNPNNYSIGFSLGIKEMQLNYLNNIILSDVLYYATCDPPLTKEEAEIKDILE